MRNEDRRLSGRHSLQRLFLLRSSHFLLWPMQMSEAIGSLILRHVAVSPLETVKALSGHSLTCLRRALSHEETILGVNFNRQSAALFEMRLMVVLLRARSTWAGSWEIPPGTRRPICTCHSKPSRPLNAERERESASSFIDMSLS